MIVRIRFTLVVQVFFFYSDDEVRELRGLCNDSYIQLYTLYL